MTSEAQKKIAQHDFEVSLSELADFSGIVLSCGELLPVLFG